jgi:hypothetical protein
MPGIKLRLNRALPQSGGRPEDATTRSLPPQPIAPQHAPAVIVPLAFILTGLVALLVALPWLAFRPDILATYHYNQYVLALTHLVNLGWVGSAIMGATYQLVPVALETRLHQERLAVYHIVAHVIGVAGMVWMFWVWDMKQVGHYGSLVALGIGVFVLNLAKTIRKAPRRDAVRLGTTSALTWLCVTAVAGLYVSAAKCWDFSPFAPISQMHAHAHAGVLGYFILMIVAVSYRLVPMFTLSEIQNPARAAWSIRLINLGLIAVFLAVLIGSSWKLAAGLVVAAGLTLHGVEIRAILRARRRPMLDDSLRCFLAALRLMAPLAVIGIVLAWPSLPATRFTTQLENVYGVLAVLGVVSLAILGMLHKVVPFLVWSSVYSKHVGRVRVPSLSELYSPRILQAAYRTYLVGLAAVCLATALGHATAVRWSCAVLSVGAVLFTVNVGLMLSHMIRPRFPAAALRATQPTP